MSETEEADNEEALLEDEYDSESIDSTNFRAYLSNQVLSFVRQTGKNWAPMEWTFLGCLLCLLINPENFCYVRVLVVCLAVHIPEWANKDSAVVTVLAVLSSVLLLYWLGRKLTVLIASLLQLLLLLRTYVRGLKFKLPYSISLAHAFVVDLGVVTYNIYLAEISSTTYRAFFLGLYLFLSGVVNKKLGNMRTELQFIPEIITPVYRDFAILTGLSILLALFLPDTPFSAILKDDPEKAEKTFAWLRSGDPDTLEFNQMIAKAENIKVNGILQRLVSRTFILGLIFSIFLMMSNFNTCFMLDAFFDDFYYPPDARLDYPNPKYFEFNKFLVARTVGMYDNFYVIALFLAYNFLIPRKIIFLVSYMSSILTITMVSLKLLPFDSLFKIVSHCDKMHALGLTELEQILPVEIYPATLREIGVGISLFWRRLNIYLFYFFQNQPKRPSPLSERLVNYTWTYTCFMASLFGVPFILLFMPETQKINMFELDKLDLHLPFTRNEDRPADEDIDTEGGGE